LKKVGLNWIINFQYNVGDFLFDAITYLLKYSINFKMMWKNSSHIHLKEFLRLGTPKALKCHRWKLTLNLLHDLHHGNANHEKLYT